MAAPYRFGEPVVSLPTPKPTQHNRRHDSRQPPLRPAGHSPSYHPPPVTPEEVALLEEAIHSFSDRFEEWMRQQSRLLEHYRADVEAQANAIERLTLDTTLLWSTVERLEAQINRPPSGAHPMNHVTNVRREGGNAAPSEERVHAGEHATRTVHTSTRKPRGKEEDPRDIATTVEPAPHRLQAAPSHPSADQGPADEASTNTATTAEMGADLAAETGADPGAEPGGQRWSAWRILLGAVDAFGEHLIAFSGREDDSDSW